MNVWNLTSPSIWHKSTPRRDSLKQAILASFTTINANPSLLDLMYCAAVRISSLSRFIFNPAGWGQFLRCSSGDEPILSNEGASPYEQLIPILTFLHLLVQKRRWCQLCMELFVKMCSLHLICLVQAPRLLPNPECPELHTTLHVYKCTDFKSPVVCFVSYSHSLNITRINCQLSISVPAFTGNNFY